MPLLDALLIVLLISVTLFIILLTVAALYLVIAVRDLHGALHDMKARLHHLASNFSDFRSMLHVNGSEVRNKKGKDA